MHRPRLAFPRLPVRLLFSIIAIAVWSYAAAAQERVNLRASDRGPVYRIQVADADELGLLQQELKIEVVQAGAREALIRLRGASPATLQRLGYELVPVPTQDVEHRIVRVPRGGSEQILLNSGVTLLRRDPKEWVVRGSLRQLQLLQNLRFQLLPLRQEARPRSVEIRVPAQNDVQRVYDLGVDIFRVQRDARGFVIGATAFDGQVDSLRALGYPVVPR